MLSEGMESRGFDDERLAAEVGIHVTYVKHMRAGRRTPEVEVLARLGEVLRWSATKRGLALGLVAAEKSARGAA